MPEESPPVVPIELTLFVDESIYHRTAVLRACYWFTDRCYLFVTRPSPGTLAVSFRAKDGSATESLHAIEGEFRNALLDFELRRQIDTETATIRELLVAKAVAEAGSLDDPPPGTANDPADERAIHRHLVQISEPQ